MTNILKRIISLLLATTIFAGISLYNIFTVSAEMPLASGDILLPPVYYMDFSPDEDGRFYDSPLGSPQRQEIWMISEPTDAFHPGGHNNVDNKIIDTMGSRITATSKSASAYVAISGGSADVNAGFTGAADDYCLKIVKDSGGSTHYASVAFPTVYGDSKDEFRKYRFEMDYKWHHYNNDTGLEEPYRLRGDLNWLRFDIAENDSPYMSLNTAGNVFALIGSSFGLVADNQPRPPVLPISASAKWCHITVDLDFEDGKIDFMIEGGGATASFSVEVPEDAEYRGNFAKGLKGIRISGVSSSSKRVIMIDNITLSPIYQTSKPSVQERLEAANNPPYTFSNIKGENTDAGNVTTDLVLPKLKSTVKGTVDVEWTLTPPNASRWINLSTGKITSPTYSEGNQTITLTPVYSLAGKTLIGDPIEGIVLAALPPNDLEKIDIFIANSPLTFNDIKGGNTSSTAVTKPLSLFSTAGDGIGVEWSVSPMSESWLVDTATGEITRPVFSEGDKTVVLIPTYVLGRVRKAGPGIEITILKDALENAPPDVIDAYSITESDLIPSGQTASSVSGNLILPHSGKVHNSTITWSAYPPIVNVETGVVKRPFGAESITVVLIAVFTNGENSTTREFAVTVVDEKRIKGEIYRSVGDGGGGGVIYSGSATVTPEKLPGNEANNGSTSEVEQIASVFNDIDSVPWAKEYISILYRRGVISGDGNGVFYPARAVTREEFVKMLLLTFDIPVDEAASAVAFEDVNINAWFAPYVSTAYRLGLSNGISESKFGTGQDVTRQDLTVMISRCLEHKKVVVENLGISSAFEDKDDISGYALSAVEMLSGAGILNGDEQGRFNPFAAATRAETAKILGMLIKNK